MRSVYFLRLAVAVFTLVLAGDVSAQMVGTNVFLQGKYVELGITPYGSYGTTTSPTTYHSHSPSGSGGPLGFVADPGMDGWAVGTPPYMGDYFYPGFPFEGWELQLSPTKRVQCVNMGGATYSGGLTGSSLGNTAYTISGSKISGTWQGTFDSVIVTQVTTVDTNDLYFTVKVTLNNMSSTPISDIYYFRSLDPDNDQTWPGGGFPTKNVIEHQMPDTFYCSVVSATGYSTSAPYLGLGTSDTLSRAVIYNAWPIALVHDLDSVYAGTYGGGSAAFYNEGVYHNGDIAVGLIIKVPHLASVDSMGDSVYRTTSVAATRHPANQASFTFFYSFSSAATDSAVVRTTLTYPTGSPGALAIKNINNEEIHVYPNPANDRLFVTGLHIGDHLAVYDMMGRVAVQDQKVLSDGTNKIYFGNTPAGNYKVVVTDANGSVKTRVSISKN